MCAVKMVSAKGAQLLYSCQHSPSVYTLLATVPVHAIHLLPGQVIEARPPEGCKTYACMHASVPYHRACRARRCLLRPLTSWHTVLRGISKTLVLTTWRAMCTPNVQHWQASSHLFCADCHTTILRHPGAFKCTTCACS